MDLIKDLGTMALASRLRRLVELLYKDGKRIYQEHSVNFEPRWFPLFYLLKESQGVSVTAAAQKLGLSHPAINQIAGEMSRNGLVESVGDKKDERKRILKLTKMGKSQLSSLEPIWADIAEATSDLIKESGGNFLAALGKFEEKLNKKGTYQRVMERLKKRQMEEVEIIEYQPKFRPYFKSLNLEWLKEYFTVEEEDEKLLSDPQKEIIKKGGLVLFALLKGKIVGTVALVKHNENTFELAKMAVSKKARGHQVGRKLALAVIDRAKTLGAKNLILLTNPRLEAACNLYRSLGFKEMSEIPKWVTLYSRGGIAISIDLRKTNKKP
jgi:ribosomal protein S18 acetylase RimI-like enzyme/predicted transcriptional regulator